MVERIVEYLAVQTRVEKLKGPVLCLVGPPGVGKTSAARVVLESVKKLPHSPFAQEAPFVEVDGTTLRWDPRDVTNPLMGSVHDPIYQGAKRDLADTGIPPGSIAPVSG